MRPDSGPKVMKEFIAYEHVTATSQASMLDGINGQCRYVAVVQKMLKSIGVLSTHTRAKLTAFSAMARSCQATVRRSKMFRRGAGVIVRFRLARSIMSR